VSDHHPTPDELAALSRGALAPRRALEVTLHLLEGCRSCRPVVPSPAEIIEPAEPALSTGDYDKVVERALAAALRQRQTYEGERTQVRRLVAELAAGGPAIVAEVRRRESGAPLVEALLERSWALRHEDPARTAELAWSATEVAADLALGPNGVKRAADLRFRAWAELGNALRVADDFDGAEQAFDTALGHWAAGTLDETLLARYLDLRASLYRARRELNSAQAALAVACSIYLRYGQRHLAGRAMIGHAIHTGLAGEPEAALQLISNGLSLIEEHREPDLVLTAVQNRICFLIECEQYDEARKILFLNRGRFQQETGHIFGLKVRWLEGRIDAGRGQQARAEEVLCEAREGFEAVGLGYNAALVTLDLAAVVLRQGRAAEASALVLEAAEAFTALRIHREMLMAVLYLRETVLQGMAEVPLVEKVAAFLRRAEHDASVRFEPQA
jgi:tetratricopeptide (TPR) repeat protein